MPETLSVPRAVRHVCVGVVLGILLVISPESAVGRQVSDGVRPAGSLAYRPDGWVRYYSYHRSDGTFVDPTPWKGDNIYNHTGKYQTAKRVNMASVSLEGTYDVFRVLIENDGPADQFHVAATGTGDWVVKYFRGAKNITSKVVDGTYMTPSLGHGEQVVLKVKVWIGDPDTSVTRLINITSVGNPSRWDTVRIKDKFSACGC